MIDIIELYFSSKRTYHLFPIDCTLTWHQHAMYSLTTSWFDVVWITNHYMTVTPPIILNKLLIYRYQSSRELGTVFTLTVHTLPPSLKCIIPESTQRSYQTTKEFTRVGVASRKVWNDTNILEGEMVKYVLVEFLCWSWSFKRLPFVIRCDRGALGFAVWRFWLFFGSVFRFLCQKNLGFSVLLFTAFCGFSAFSIWISVLVKNLDGYSDLVSNKPFRFVIFEFRFLFDLSSSYTPLLISNSRETHVALLVTTVSDRLGFWQLRCANLSV